MTADAADERRRRWWERRRWRALIALLLIFAVALGVIWSQRRPIAQGFVDRELAKRGVPARYRVADIGLSTQRLENVVIGDPRAPDLVADWVEVRTDVGLGGARLAGIVAGQVRMKARLVDGALSFGTIDRLLPPPSGQPFALPALDTDLRDVRMRIETPHGAVGARLSGSGRLDDGFAGRLALISDRIEAGECAFDRPRVALAVRVGGGRPSIEGPSRIAAARCGDVQAIGLAADVAATIGAALDRWTGRARFAAQRVAAPAATTGQVMGRISFDGSATATAGVIRMTAMHAVLAQGRAGSAGIDGRYRVGRAGAEFAGRASATAASASETLVRRVAQAGGAGAGTPLAPLVQAMARAGAGALRDVGGDAAVEAVMRDGAQAVRVTAMRLASASGARVDLGGAPLRFGQVELGGRVTVRGGGLPDVAIDLRRTGAGIAGRAVVQPYAAGSARLALSPVDFVAGGGGLTRVTTTATLSGPLGDGRVDGLTLPIDARWRGTALAVNPTCAPLGWGRLAVSGLELDSARLTLCPEGSALVTFAGGRVGGGARAGATRLAGRLGGTPLALEASGMRFGLADNGFRLADVRTRLGPPDRVTRIDAAALTGRIVGGAVTGDFSGGGGQIANVPLVLADAAGTWRFAGGRLALDGGMTVSDAAAERRFEPLASRDMTLTLVGNRIDARGTLSHPAKGICVADVVIAHDLGHGTGEATLDVPRLQFGDRLQPNELTPITYGVIADVQGDVSGRGRIAWTPDGVTSTGRFATPAMDLAAAFGPVTGIKGEIAFTDLLGLVSAPDQVATIVSINPGIAVENGTIRYQLTGENRVLVTGGSWPFANGQLLLDRTLLDFSAQKERRMTFRVQGADAAAFLQQFDFDNLDATGTFDGVLPMVFDETGGRIVDGRLAARSGGSLAYVGTITEKDVGVWGNMAFQALKAMSYRELGITMNGPLAGEMVTQIRFAGVSQGQGTKSNFLIRRLAKLPLVFNITVTAPFRQLLDSVRSYYDPSRLIERNLPALLDERKRREQGIIPTPPPIQPPESEKKP
ncbi:YdbH domain-containing protein [Sphingomonas sp.]|uniref:YdbH domain-containing protein n=1 Tax=Sphingomonas sp. TaxID=28214 RepID=UPI002DD6B62A|nr:YdbH domain-containing protein [Sphingomonas sp.]